MDLPSNEKLIKHYEQTLKEGEIGLDEELSKEFLREKHPECEEALVQALEQVRAPIRAEYMQRLREALDAHSERMSETTKQFGASADALIKMVREHTEFEVGLHGRVSAEFEHHALKPGLSEEELTRRLDQLHTDEEEERWRFKRKQEEEMEAIKEKIPNLWEALTKSERQLEEETLPLIEQYVTECFEKSRPVYEEFLTS